MATEKAFTYEDGKLISTEEIEVPEPVNEPVDPVEELKVKATQHDKKIGDIEKKLTTYVPDIGPTVDDLVARLAYLETALKIKKPKSS